MAGKDRNQHSRPRVPAYGNGLVPTYFSGTAAPSEVPYSKNVKLAGYIMVLALVVFMVWFVISFIMSQM